MQKLKLAILLLASLTMVSCAGYRDYRQAQAEAAASAQTRKLL